jgi:hypothetical protein
MIRSFVITAMSAAALFVSTAAPAQQTGGTAVEARAMLTKAVAAVKEDKTKALDMFDKGGGGFRDRDLYVFVTVSATRSSSPLAIPTASRNSVRT